LREEWLYRNDTIQKPLFAALVNIGRDEACAASLHYHIVLQEICKIDLLENHTNEAIKINK